MMQAWMMASLIGMAVLFSGCGSSTDTATPEPEPEPVAAESVEESPEMAETSTLTPEQEAENAAEEAVLPEDRGYPSIGVITEAQSGDIMCYATVMDRQGQEFEIGAGFEICDRSETLFNQTVRFVYSEENVADCESAEPCGKSRTETLITDVVMLGDSWQVLSNGKWTVTVGQLDSWDGVNNTGGLTYYGCDTQGNCLALDGGVTICRNGICNMAWENGNYAYTLSTELTETGDSPTTLLVWNGSEEILNSPGLELVDSSDW
jgi:hypothetical protein